MRTKSKIIILFTILMIIGNYIIFTNISIGTTSINQADLYSKGSFNGLLRFGGVNIECTFVVYQKDGIEYPAYCINKDLPGVGESGSYSVSVDSLVSNVLVWKVITNGYPYKSAAELGCDNDEQAYLATKQAVYCVLYDRDPSVSYSAIGAGGEKCLNALINIVAAARSSGATKISSNISIQASNTKWEIDSADNKYASTTYAVVAAGGMNKYTIELEGEMPEGTYVADESNNVKNEFNSGERFKILIPITNITKDGNFNINVKGQVNTKPILYGRAPSSSLQDYALAASIYEDGIGTQKIYYSQNSTKIIILKQETDTKNPLAGVEFELLDENQKVIRASLVTDGNGEIHIGNLLPGTYYIRETKTLEGYLLYDKLIEVKLDLNEELTVIVNNGIDEITIENERRNSAMEVENKVSNVTVKLPKTGM